MAASDAGETVWVRHPESGQVEAQSIRSDGRYELYLRFSGIDADSRLPVETPSCAVSGRLSKLTAGVVTGRA